MRRQVLYALLPLLGIAAPAAAQAPPVPTDHLADRYYDLAAMAAARRQLAAEHGGSQQSMVMVNLLEAQAGPQGGYRWDAQAWYGGDLDRLVAKSEGDGGLRGGLGAAEAQALLSHAISPYFDLQAGVRQDLAPVGRTYAAVGIEGLLPYWLHVDGALFVSTRGDALGRLEGSYDLRLTQRLILQPRAELNLAAAGSRQTRTGPGLADAELGLRLRYEIVRRFAPYVGMTYDQKTGRTAAYARLFGQNPDATRLVVGLAGWF